jgi:apolipoprotein N-acyltransferase
MMSSRWRAAGFLVLAAAVSTLANGPHAVAVAAWLAPLFWLRALHRLPVRAGAAVGGLFYGAATIVAARGMLPLTGGWYVLAAMGIGMGALFPFVIHRALAPRLPLPLVPLLFPVAATALEFLGGRVQPFGSFGAVAYTQVGSLALLQLAAVAGLPGIALLLYLPAALLHWALDHGPSRAQLWRGSAAAGLLLLAVAGLGTRRLGRSGGETASVAVVSSPLHGRLSELLMPAYATGDPAGVSWDAALRQGEAVTADLLQRTARAAAAGARIVVWPETAAIVALAAEPALVQTAGALARAQRVYLALALGVVRHRVRPWPSGDGAIDNKVLLLGPTGEVLAEYRKSIPVPGPEAELLVPSNGRIPIVDTPYGRIGLAICFDLDFPRLMRRAAGVDLLLVPAEDWPGITPYHSDMARLRAIEGGYALVRAARYGRSIATDAYGRLWGARDDSADSSPDGGTLSAQLPIGGRRTIYSVVGDVVGWLTVGGLFLLGLVALAGPRVKSRTVLTDGRRSGAGDDSETPS